MAESFNSASILTSYQLLNSWLYSFYLPEVTGNKFPCFCKNKAKKLFPFRSRYIRHSTVSTVTCLRVCYWGVPRSARSQLWTDLQHHPLGILTFLWRIFSRSKTNLTPRVQESVTHFKRFAWSTALSSSHWLAFSPYHRRQRFSYVKPTGPRVMTERSFLPETDKPFKTTGSLTGVVCLSWLIITVVIIDHNRGLARDKKNVKARPVITGAGMEGNEI